MNKRQKEVLQTQLNNEKAVLKKLEANYQDALSEINSKIELLMARQDADMQHVIYQVEYQKALKTQVQAILENLQTNEFETVSEYLAKSYDDGFIGTMYDLQGQGIPLIFPIDQEQVVDAIQAETKLSENLYAAMGHDIKDLQKKISGEISRGLSGGQMYSEITRNIASWARIPKNNAVRIARTEAHRIQTKASMNACNKAKSKGADVVKQWDASLDKRTRDSHAQVDGEIRELDEPFSNGLMYPGDPNGSAAEVINCRCALLQRARWALGNDYTKWSPDAPIEISDDGTTQFAIIEAKNYKEFQKKYAQASERVRESVQKMNDGFIPAKTMEEAVKYAESLGVKYPVYDKLPLDTINELNKAVLNLPKSARPIFVGDSRTLEEYFGGHGYRLQRKTTQFYGVTLEEMSGIHLGYGKGYDFDTHGSMVGISTSFKTMDKISKHKIEYQATYRSKYGKDAFYNVSGKATIHHEMGHCYKNKFGLPDGFEADAQRWARETGCQILENPTEAFCEAWGAYYSGTKTIPDYIEKYIKKIELENTGKSSTIKVGQTKAYTKIKVADIPSMDEAKFDKIKRGLEKNGVTLIQDADGDAYLEYMKAEAMTLSDGSAVIFQSGRVPSASAVFEEVIHASQIKKYGMVETTGDIKARIEYLNREIEANEKLLKYKKAYGLTKEDIESVEENLAKYYKELKGVT